MSRTLANMSRALSSYGSQAAGIHRDAGRNASMLRMRAADIRADATRQRGQNFAGMASGIGQMVGQEMLQAPIRERENQMQDLNMRMGEQRLERGEQEMAARAKALEEKQKVKARREQYISILSDHYGDPAGTMKALKDAGMVEEMNAEYQKIMMLREQKAKTNTAEWKEAETQARLVSETIGGLLRLEGPARDEGYSIARSRILSLMPDLESFLPETPDAQTYELLGDNATMLRTAADQMGMDESEIKKVEAARKRQEGKEKKAGDIFDKAIVKLSKTSKGFWDNEVAFQRKKIEKNSPDQLEYFDQITSGGHNRETKSALKAWAGEKGGFTGEYGNYRRHAEESGGSPMGPLDFAQAMAKARKPEGEAEKDPITPSQALALINFVKSTAKDRRDSEAEYFDMPMDQVEQKIAEERGWDLARLQEQAEGKGARMSMPMLPAPAHTPGNNPASEPEIVEFHGKRYRKIGPDQYVEDPE